MSHFSVIVFGENVDEQLAPYHEFECTGVDDEYVQDIDITQEILDMIVGGQDGKEPRTLSGALGYYGLEDRMYASQEEADENLDDEAKYGYAIVREGHLVKAVNRTNPNCKWDWYVVGGRWSGSLKGVVGAKGIKSDKKGWFDQLKKRDIDIAGMIGYETQQATQEYEKAHAIIAGRQMLAWEEVRERHGEGNIDNARDEYNNDPVIKDLREAGYFFWGDGPKEKFECTLETFIERRVNAMLTPYAFIQDGQWIEKGQMGWWGMSSNEMSQDEWNAKFMETFNSLPDDTLVTMVDCHI